MTKCSKLKPAGIVISRFFKVIFPNQDGIFEKFAQACTELEDWKNSLKKSTE
jgi:hypothetical protein